MSDETPTERLPEPDDAPTKRLDTGESRTPPADGAPAPGGERTRSRGLLIALIVVGALLVVAVVVLLLVLVLPKGGAAPEATPGSASPSASPTPTERETPSSSPTPTETSAPQPPPQASPIVSYTVSSRDVDCSGTTAVPITFNWNTTGQSVAFGIGTDNADQQPYEQGLDAVGGITVDYQCGQPDGRQRYAIAVEFGGSIIDRETIVVTEH